MDTNRYFQNLVLQRDDQINLAEAALHIALDEYPQLNVDSYIRQLAGWARELKTPLAVIRAATEGLEGQIQGVPLGMTFLDEVKSANRRLERIVTNLLDNARSFSKHGGSVRAVAADVTDEDAVVRAVDFAAEPLGALHGVVASAGGSESIGPVTQLDATAFRNTLDLNVTGTMLVLKHAARVMEPCDCRPLAIGRVGRLDGARENKARAIGATVSGTSSRVAPAASG